MNLPWLFRLPVQLLSLPEVEIRMCGNVSCKKIFDNFTQSHPKYKIVQKKRWGVALLPLPDSFEDYLRGRRMQNLRTGRKRGISSGFTFGPFDPREHLDDILSINMSTGVRQGMPMDSKHLRLEWLKEYFKETPTIFGVFDREHVLKAYAETPTCGDVFLFSSLLGHADDLNQGIMYLLLSEVIRTMIEKKRSSGAPLWAMYDTFFGGADGLRTFKSNIGFEPYKVRWLWGQAD